MFGDRLVKIHRMSYMISGTPMTLGPTSVPSSSSSLTDSPILNLGQRIAAEIFTSQPTFSTWAMSMMPGLELANDGSTIVMADWHNRPKRKRRYGITQREAAKRCREEARAFKQMVDEVVHGYIERLQEHGPADLLDDGYIFQPVPDLIPQFKEPSHPSQNSHAGQSSHLAKAADIGKLPRRPKGNDDDLEDLWSFGEATKPSASSSSRSWWE
jgi:hypothetical protein